jgi:hypothetical protein
LTAEDKFGTTVLVSAICVVVGFVG